MKVGYARASSTDQNLDNQFQALEGFGCEKVFQEKQSGKTAAHRGAITASAGFHCLSNISGLRNSNAGTIGYHLS